MIRRVATVVAGTTLTLAALGLSTPAFADPQEPIVCVDHVVDRILNRGSTQEICVYLPPQSGNELSTSGNRLLP